MKIVFAGEVDARAETGVKTSQPEGIGRVAGLRVSEGLGDLWAWNNLGRNVVFADAALATLGVRGDTAFPGDDEASQYDLDVHAIVRPSPDRLIVVNHLGLARAYSFPVFALISIEQHAPDAERVVWHAGRLVSSLPGWDPLTALEAHGDLLAAGAGARVALVDRWETTVPWHAAWLAFAGDTLLVAGWEPEPGAGDHDWDRLAGGGLRALALDDGRALWSRPVDLAWGNGGVALCLCGGAIVGFDRRGGAHAFAADDGRPLGSTPPFAERSLGIAHAAAMGDTALCGFNRAGYRLFRWRIER